MVQVAIAGASGFVGRALVRHLAGLPQPPTVVGLSRRAQAAHADGGGGTTWRACNLFNLLHTERALEGSDVAVYLVHSMSPQAALAQGHFADMDLICADNFARAARRQGVRHIVYLGGLIPPERPLSAHLESRLEVEGALGAQGVPLTTLRAGLVLGAGGSSFEMMTRLVRRLPMMVAPRWTSSRTQPIALDDVVALLGFALAHPELTGPFDVGCPDVLTYAQMLTRTGELMQRPRPIVTVPIEAPTLSLWWVSLVTGSPLQLVVPLVESLRHDMVVGDGGRLMAAASLSPQPFDAAMGGALAASARALPARRPAPVRRQTAPGAARTVVSVQRLPLPAGADAAWVAQAYAEWLPQFLWPILRVDVTDARVYRFCLPLGRRPLLELTFAPARSDARRQLFYISGGLLARGGQPEPGRFEFRCVLGDRWVLSAVHDFAPQLPWYIYKMTQALAHAAVMYFFGRHLARRHLPPAGRAA